MIQIVSVCLLYNIILETVGLLPLVDRAEYKPLGLKTIYSVQSLNSYSFVGMKKAKVSAISPQFQSNFDKPIKKKSYNGFPYNFSLAKLINIISSLHNLKCFCWHQYAIENTRHLNRIFNILQFKFIFCRSEI